jgi:2-methylcitrate dehydratase PrpD
VLGKAGLEQFTDACARDGAVMEMRRRITVVRDPAIPVIAAEVALTTTDGKTHHLSTRAARGGAANPMSDRELEDKLRAAAAGWQPGYDPAPLIAAIWALDRSEDASRLLALTVPR